jgi:hypothetical protein
MPDLGFSLPPSQSFSRLVWGGVVLVVAGNGYPGHMPTGQMEEFFYSCGRV